VSANMRKLEVLTAVAAPLDMNNVDTDQIFPARFTSKDRKIAGYGDCYLHDLRYDPAGAARENFILNDARLRNAEIIVAGANYACGSARPGAVYTHLDRGLRAVVAESFGPLFSAVAYKSGLLAIQIRSEEASNLRKQLRESIGSRVTIDLPSQVVVAPDRARYAFEIDPFVKRMIVEGLDEIELTLGLSNQIEAFAARQRDELPWLSETP
jgi:3-isopropylmalate/(R)-2-methylmalate dehydratase small subunit